ncbi:MAG: hypothetical protein R3E08_05125 [Thiotrichaceae bacterium]
MQSFIPPFNYFSTGKLTIQYLLDATYHQGMLVLSQPLQKELEGKHFKVVLFEENVADKANFLQFVENHAFTLPKDYQLKREEFYES